MQLFMRHPGPLPSVPIQPPDGFVIREATIADRSALARVLTVTFEEGWDEPRVDNVLLEAPDVPRTWVVIRGDEVVGTASERITDLYPAEGYVHFVAVLPSASGFRLGELATHRCLTGFAERGLGTAVLETDAFRQAAIRTYLRLGFIPDYRSDEERHAWSSALQLLNQPTDVRKPNHV